MLKGGGPDGWLASESGLSRMTLATLSHSHTFMTTGETT